MNSERILWWLCISIIITIEIVSGQRVSGKDFFHYMVPFLMALAKCKKMLMKHLKVLHLNRILELSFSPVFTAFHIRYLYSCLRWMLRVLFVRAFVQLTIMYSLLQSSPWCDVIITCIIYCDYYQRNILACFNKMFDTWAKLL